MIVAGIDPGIKGGLVILEPGRVAGQLMPLCGVKGREIDGAAVMAWLLVNEPDLVVLEKVQARNTLGDDGTPIRRTGAEFRFATGYGVLQGVLQSLALDYRLVTPQRWKRAVLAGTLKDKDAAIAHVQRTLPDLNLIPGRCRVPQDGLADAACLALYGRDFLKDPRDA